MFNSIILFHLGELKINIVNSDVSLCKLYKVRNSIYESLNRPWKELVLVDLGSESHKQQIHMDVQLGFRAGKDIVGRFSCPAKA